MTIVDFDSFFAKIQIHLIHNLHVYLIKFRTNYITRIGVNTTCKKKKKKKKKKNIFALTASLQYPYLLCTHGVITISVSSASHKYGNSYHVRKTLVVFRFRIFFDSIIIDCLFLLHVSVKCKYCIAQVQRAMWFPIVFISTPDEINMAVENQAVCF